MRTRIVVATCAVALVAGVACAELTWCGESAMNISNQTTGATAWYDGSTTWAGTTWDSAPDLGTIDLGDALYLGGELQSYDTSGDTASMWYRINSGTYTEIALPYLEPANSNDKWQAMYSTDVASGLSAGTYTVDVYFHTTDNDVPTTVYDNNSGNDYTGATFTVAAVPEPGTLTLLGLGLASGIAMLRRRKA